MKDLIRLDGQLNGKILRVRKDDGCNTNVVSHEFFFKNHWRFNWKRRNVEFRHSKLGSVESSPEIILEAALTIERHLYK